jgi:hypothetical protein
LLYGSIKIILKIKFKGLKMRNIIKIEINKKEKKAVIYDKNKTVDMVTFNNDLNGYITLRTFSCSDMLNLDKVSYYNDLSIRDKNILDNCDEIKLNINNVSYDFISPVGILNINIKK